MKKLFIVLTLGVIILSGFVAVSPTLFMNPMSGDMSNMDSDCIGHCLKTTPLNMHNSVPMPLVVQIIGIFVSVILGIIFIYRFNWTEEKILKFSQLFIFDTVFLRE